MRPAFVLLAMLSLCGGPAALAETVPVRSGEHAGFARLVFPLAEPTDWRLGRDGNGYVLRFGRTDMAFDLGRVFRFIRRDRIASVTADPEAGLVRVALACTCHADAFELRPGLVVLDIKDGPPPATGRFEARLAPVAAAAVAPVLPPPAMARPPIDPIGPFALPSDGPDAARAAQLQRRLARDLGRAAAQGLIAPEIDLPVQAAPAARRRAAPVPAPPPVPEGPQMRVSTSIDRGLGAVAHPPVTESGTACLPDDLFALGDWTGPHRAAADIGAARAALFDGRDRAVPGAALHLARTYLALGFGAEARAALAEAEPPARQVWLLLEMAEIIDHGAARHPAKFAPQMSCSGDAALWAVLAQPHLARGVAIDRAAVRRAFSGLPPHLRRLLGPPLVARFLDIGDRDTASVLRAALDRPGASPAPETRLLEARVALDGAHPEAAEAALSALAARGGAAGAEAAAMLLEHRIARGVPPTTDAVLAALALAHEHRRGPLGPRLVRAAVKGLALGGAFDDALAQMRRHGLLADRALCDAVLATLTDRGGDAAFLRQVAAALSGAGLTLPESGLPAPAAVRLAGLGFSVEEGKLRALAAARPAGAAAPLPTDAAAGLRA
ncbi:hypothetical protein EJA01_15875, partial [Rhodovulum iodosum]